MPKVRKLPGYFSLDEVHRITGISKPMINYLRQQDMLSPGFTTGKPCKGKVRYYAYRDLVVGKTIQKLRDTGVELTKIKAVIEYCKTNKIWDGLAGDTLRYLVTDGKSVLVQAEDGFFEDASGQRSFAFAIDLKTVQAEVFDLLEPEDQKVFSLQAPTAEAISLIYEPRSRKKA